MDVLFDVAAEKNGKGERKMGQREHRMKNRVREQNYDMLSIIFVICIMLILIGDVYGVYILKCEPIYYVSWSNIGLMLTIFAVPCFLMISETFILTDFGNRDSKLLCKVSYFASAFLVALQKKGIAAILVDMVSVMDLLIIRCRNRKDGPQNEDIILVRLDAIGDFVMWLDAAKEFRKNRKGKIILICNQICSEIAGNTGYFDEVIGLNYGKLRHTSQVQYRWSIHSYLKDVKAGRAIQCTYSKEIFSDMVMSAITANEKVTMDSPEEISTRWCYRIAGSIYQKVIVTPREHMMEISRNTLFAGQVLEKEIRSGVPSIREMKKAQGKVPADRYYVLFLGASEKERMWPVERYAELADRLNEKAQYEHLKCCLCGGKEEAYLADEFTEKYFSKEKIINRVGETSLPELIEIIRKAEFIVTNDTSAVHFAAAVNTQAFCIWGPWEYGRFLPYKVEKMEDRKLPIVCYHEIECRNCLLDGRGKTGECMRFIQSKGIRRCLSEVTVDDVLEKIDQKM